MTTVIFIRHGQSEANLGRVFAGHFDAPLSPLGHQQAKKTAEAVASKFHIDKIYASDLLRAYDTGKYLADLLGMEIIPDTNFREIFAGAWEGQRVEDIMEKYADDFEVWKSDMGNSRPTDGESTRELGERILARTREVVAENEGKTVVVATHAAAIRALMTMCSGKEFSAMQDIPFVSNASYSVLVAENGRFEFTEVSCDDHLEGIKTAIPAYK